MESLPTANQGYWDSIPHHYDEDESARLGGRSLKGTAGHGTFKLPRRSLFKAAGVLGAALAVTVVSSVPQKFVPKALADIGNEYTTGCGGYEYDGIICYGGEYSSGYCGSDGWFRHSYGTVNYWPVKRCGNGPRNAWRWTHNGTSYRCADGYIQYGSQSPIFVICSKANP
jgi:hypothetical protein